MQPMHRGEALGMSFVRSRFPEPGMIPHTVSDTFLSLLVFSPEFLFLETCVKVRRQTCSIWRHGLFGPSVDWVNSWRLKHVEWWEFFCSLAVYWQIFPQSPCFEHLCFTRVECASACCNTRWQCDALCSVPWFFLPLWDVQTLGEVYSLDCWTPRFSNLQLLPK